MSAAESVRISCQVQDEAAAGSCYSAINGDARLLCLHPAAGRHPGAVEVDASGLRIPDNDAPGKRRADVFFF